MRVLNDMLSPEERKFEIFRIIVREYLRTADPVGSETVAALCPFGVSSATIRNDMADLEAMGLLAQPHTSAGRIPSEKGYKFYVETFARDRAPKVQETERLKAAAEQLREREEAAMRQFAKTLALVTGETVVVEIGGNAAYVAGIANLLRKPEFREVEALLGIAMVLDDAERALDSLRLRSEDDVEVVIGRENPFGEALAAVLTKYDSESIGEGIVGILGPTRMDYDANIAFARHIHELISGL